jgi:hypothetical protein
MKKPKCSELKHPNQPIGWDNNGVARFKENAIVRLLLDTSPLGLNKIAVMNWPDGDYTHLMQLIGYSVSGYGDLSSSPPETVAAADKIVDRLIKLAEEDDKS